MRKNKTLQRAVNTHRLSSLLTDPQKRRYIAVKIAEKIAAKPMVAHFAGRLLMTPPQAKKSEASIEFLKTGKTFSVTSDGEKIRAWSFGRGPLVLLVHGWGGYGAQLKEFVAPLAASGHEVVLFDAYGHGESGGQVSSVVHIARSIKAVLSYFVRVPKAIIAHSMGTSALLLHLSIHKTEIDFLTLVSAPIEGPLVHSKKFAEKVNISEHVRSQMQAQLEWQFDHPWDELEIPPLLDFAKASKTLLIHDENDKVVPVSHLGQIHQGLPDSAILRTEGLGHFRILEDKKVVAQVMQHLNLKINNQKEI